MDIGYQTALATVDSAQYVVAATETSTVKANYPTTANTDLKRAQRIVAGVIYKFYHDVGAIK